MDTDLIEISADEYTIRIRQRDLHEHNPAPRVYVADRVAEARSTDLADLERQESDLGERRFAERGQFADVDDLYDRLNDETMRVKTLIAREVLASLHLMVDGDLDTAIGRAFFSRKAGGDMCPCSPGVVAGVKLTWHGDEFDVWVEAVK
jgi:hypothetical protein